MNSTNHIWLKTCQPAAAPAYPSGLLPYYGWIKKISVTYSNYYAQWVSRPLKVIDEMNILGLKKLLHCWRQCMVLYTYIAYMLQNYVHRV